MTTVSRSKTHRRPAHACRRMGHVTAACEIISSLNFPSSPGKLLVDRSSASITPRVSSSLMVSIERRGREGINEGGGCSEEEMPRR